jgi:hypothetical protein
MPFVCGLLALVRVIDVFDCEVELVFVMLGLTAELCPTIGEYATEHNLMSTKAPEVACDPPYLTCADWWRIVEHQLLRLQPIAASCWRMKETNWAYHNQASFPSAASANSSLQ